MVIDSGTLTREGEGSDWTGMFTWRVKNWTNLKEKKIYSPEFEVGGYTWQLIVFPSGNKAKRSADHISVYLFFPEASLTPPQMCPKVNFELKAVKSAISGVSIRHKTTHKFTAQAAYWGFAKLLPLQDLQNPEAGYLVNDVLVLKVKIHIEGIDDLGTISKLETGFLGIKSPEDTAFLSCFLQCLFHIKLFRKAVFEMPNAEADDLQKSFPLSLQRLFYSLQYQNTSARLKELIEALDWDSSDKKLQQDVVEVQRTLFDKLSEEDNAAVIMDCISGLFMGEYSNYIQSPSIHEAQISKQSYIGIPLDVVEGKDIYASLEKFCEMKKSEKDDLDQITSAGFRDSKHYSLFNSFPTVLQINLNQYYYNPDYNGILKASSNYQFYDELDLDYKDGILLSKDADRTIKNKYKLYSMLVQADDFDGERYSLFVRPHGQWYKFDGEVVTIASGEQAFNAQFGDPLSTTIANFLRGFNIIDKSTVVMLVYIRQSEWERVMCTVGKGCISKQVEERFDKEERNKVDAHLYVNITLVTKLHFIEESGTSFYFDSTDFETVKNYRLYKKTRFEAFKEMVNEDFKIPKTCQRFWQWNPQSDNTVRVYNPLNKSGIDLKTVLDLRYFRDKTTSLDQEANALMTIKLFLESPNRSFLNGDILRPIQTNERLIFLKFYDPESSKLSYLGHVFVERTCLDCVIFERAKKMAGLTPEDNVVGFEDDLDLPRLNGLDPVLSPTVERSLLAQGDIVVIQKAATNCDFPFPTVGKFLDFILNRKRVIFRPLKSLKDKGFKLGLSKTMTYEQLTNKLAKRLKVDDPKKLRLTKHNGDTCTPYWSPIKYKGINSLKQVIMYKNHYTCILYYEVLNEQLPYLESVKKFKIKFKVPEGELESEHHFTMKKEKTVSDLVKALKVELGKGYMNCDMRVMENLFSKYFRVLDPDRVLDTLHENCWIFRADVIPEDQKSLKSDEFLVLFCHSKQDDDFLTVAGDPFWIKVKEGDTMGVVKSRVHKALEISDEDFNHWKFAYCSHPDRPVKYFKDEDKIFVDFPRLLFSRKTNEKLFADGVPFIAVQRANTTPDNRTTFWRRHSVFSKCLSCIDTLYG